ncbi:hypothetical protein QN277_012070 [Acacia crassicarpa]|uniref:Alpha/beta hydrolase fold-3 domain-containing protein n=1 Tax=Acacia crassicarpa TaxID=499986 RepID=A0AAE1TE49_9FABA|nr:hypothetical protein QN277_012070 [Acacia crassicarpa]
MSQQPQDQVLCTIDPYQYLQITRNPDGSITRLLSLPTTAASPNANTSSPVLSKDLPLNPNNATFLRLYLPHKAITSSSSPKLPLIVYFHGGGFVLLSASSSLNHDFCSEMATQLSAVIVSVEYRLAPEARLPTAYDDAVEALHWLRTTEEKWIREFSDASSCFLMGTSAGGNMAYYVGLRVAASVDELGPLKIKGLILHQPFFGGSQRTESEVRLANNPTLPLSGGDLLWELSLPVGADRDHEYCNPTAMRDWSAKFDEIERLRWEVVLTACDGDPTIDRQMEVVKMLRSRGVKVVDHVGEGFHGMDVMELSKAGPLFNLIKGLIH